MNEFQSQPGSRQSHETGLEYELDACENDCPIKLEGLEKRFRNAGCLIAVEFPGLKNQEQRLKEDQKPPKHSSFSNIKSVSRKPSIGRKSRRFLFTSSSDIDSIASSDAILQSSSRFAVAKSNDVLTKESNPHQPSYETGKPKDKLLSFTLCREAPIQAKGKSRSKSHRSQSQNLTALQSSPYNQVLVNPHSARKTDATRHKGGLGASDGRWKKLKGRKDKPFPKASVENKLNPITTSGESVSTRSVKKRSSVNVFSRLKHAKSFILLNDTAVEQRNLNCSFILDVLHSFVQRGSPVNSQREELYEVDEVIEQENDMSPCSTPNGKSKEQNEKEKRELLNGSDNRVDLGRN